MGRHDDIADAFDDDALRSSLEAADRQGDWRTGPTSFDDPKVRELARQLAQAPRETYTERRLQELQRRIAAKESARERPKTVLFGDQAAPLEQVFMAAPLADEWREPGEPTPAPTRPAAAPVAVAQPHAERPMQEVVVCLRSIGAAIVVFGAAAIVQGLCNGWTVSLGVRSAIAAGTAGLVWYLASAARYRSAMIGIGVHLLAFLGAPQTGSPAQIVGTLLGMLLVLFGSVAAGLWNESAFAADPE